MGTVDIGLTSATTPSGGTQTLFVCPISTSRCRVLFAIAERVGSAAALGLAYPSQSTSPRRRAVERRDRLVEQVSNPRIQPERRARLLERLSLVTSVLRGTEDEDWKSAVVLEDQRTSLRLARRRIRVVDPPAMSSRAAMLHGRRAPDRPTSEYICRSLDYFVRLGGPAAKPGPPPSGLEPASAFPFLDIRDFAIGQGHAPGRLLVWPDSPEGPVRLRVRLDAERRRLLISFDGGAPHRLQTIALVGGQRHGDRFMICPVTGDRHLRLYLRDGRFAGRAVQNLMTATEWERWRRQVGR
ncbi:MAG: hypothetical protein EON90_12915 [Brevundimonas sp.]|nr:MAG: hypothetical protein EON90_12915 [Brevundimonas sp.]